MNWENKLKATNFLSLRNKEGEAHQYIKLEDAYKIGVLAWNESLEKLKELYNNDREIVESVNDLKL